MHRYKADVHLNNISLQHLSPQIRISNIEESSPSVDIQTAGRPGFTGQRFLHAQRQELDIRITVTLLEWQDISKRAYLLDMINGWMQPGELRTTYRPNRKLWVVPVGSPTFSSPMTLEFAAYDIPYWETVIPEQYTLTSAAGGNAMTMVSSLGTAPFNLCEVILTNNGSAALNTASVGAGDTLLNFTGLSIAAGGQLYIHYDERAILHIDSASQSKLSCRTADSSDNLLIPCGTPAPISVTGNQAISARFEIRGLWK